MAEMERFKREVVDKIMTDGWYMEMVEKDQDDCTKRLICEVSHKKASGKKLNSIEEAVMDTFGKGELILPSPRLFLTLLLKLANIGRLEELDVTFTEGVILLLMTYLP